jgi:hypothetical protein
VLLLAVVKNEGGFGLHAQNEGKQTASARLRTIALVCD